MKQYLLIITLVFAVCGSCFLASPAAAGDECARPGCARVAVKDELGNTIAGAAAELRLPGADGELLKGSDDLLTRIDGRLKGPAADGDKAEADGDIEFDLPALGQKLKAGTAVMLTVNAATQGLVVWSTATVIPSDGALVVESSNSYALIVSVMDEREVAVSGLAVKAGKCEAVDGGEKDADGKADGEIFAMCPSVLNDEAEVQILTAPGGTELYKTTASLNPAVRVRVEAVVKITK